MARSTGNRLDGRINSILIFRKIYSLYPRHARGCDQLMKSANGFIKLLKYFTAVVKYFCYEGYLRSYHSGGTIHDSGFNWSLLSEVHWTTFVCSVSFIWNGPQCILCRYHFQIIAVDSVLILFHYMHIKTSSGAKCAQLMTQKVFVSPHPIQIKTFIYWLLWDKTIPTLP